MTEQGIWTVLGWPRCNVSADTGVPEDTREVGAVDWLSGALLLPKKLDGCEGSD